MRARVLWGVLYTLTLVVVLEATYAYACTIVSR